MMNELQIKKRKILVTGKNGYVSNCFKEYMKKFSEYEVELITVRDDKWKNYNFGEYYAIFNTVGLTHNDARKGSRDAFMKLNTELPYELAKKAKSDGSKIFINMCSMIVYGNMSGLGQKQVILKETVPNPSDSIYGISKLEGERRIQTLGDENFFVSSIRSPLIYGCNAPDNVKRLIHFAKISPLFPKYSNSISMIYDENLCELIRLIIENRASGIFYPQMEKSIETSKFVKDIANTFGHKIWLTKIFNPLLKVLSYKMKFIEKTFGNQEYTPELSNAFEGKYRIVSYEDSIKKITY